MLLFFTLLLFNSTENVKAKYYKAVRTQNPLDALEYYREIINDAPKTPYADSSLFRIGMFYYLIGDFDQVINTLEIIYNRGNKSTLYQKACYWLKRCYENIEDTVKVKEFASIVDTLGDLTRKEPDSLLINNSDTQIDATMVYTIQLGAYRDREWSDLFLKRLKECNIESHTIEKGEYVKVCSGKFSTRAEADRWLIELRNNGFDGFVIKVKP